ncbi:MAG: ABC transporter permease, partial [Clostridia bacterium]
MNDTNLNFTAKTRQFGVRTLDYIKNKGKQNLIIASATIILFFVFALLNPNFLNPITIRTMVKSATPYVILALGVTFVIATGGIDLSIGTVTIASAALGGKMFMMGVPLWLVLIFMILIGTLFGIINGFLVANLKLPPFIATLGTMMFSRGISAIIIVQPNVQFPQGSWLQKAFTDYNGFPMGLIWIALFTVICMILMYKSKAGRYILAVGSNEQATRLSGVKSDNYKMLAYVLCGMFAGIASIFFATNSIQIAGASGNGMELDAIAGVYIGGTSAAGGIASVFGS